MNLKTLKAKITKLEKKIRSRELLHTYYRQNANELSSETSKLRAEMQRLVAEYSKAKK